MTYRYKTVKVDGRTKLLHRYVMEQHIGRPLLRSEHVHHVNGERHDNRIENLALVDGQQHLEEHGRERRKHPFTKPCAVCGTLFTPHKTKRKRAKTCSWACRSALLSKIHTRGAP